MRDRSDADLLRDLLSARDPELAPRLLAEVGGVHGLDRLDARVLGVSSVARRRIEAALELGRRYVEHPLERGEVIRGAFDVNRRLRARLGPLEQEELHVLGLDAAHRLLSHRVAARGTLNQVYANVRDIFRPLVRAGAHSAILVHNHPTGVVAPSPGDAELTERVRQSGELLGICLLDHIIIGREGYFSFAEQRSARPWTGEKLDTRS